MDSSSSRVQKNLLKSTLIRELLSVCLAASLSTATEVNNNEAKHAKPLRETLDGN